MPLASKHISLEFIMTKQPLFLFILLIAVYGGSFVKADAPPSYLLFHAEAKERLDSLELNPNNTNLLERIILLHNLALHNKDGKDRERAEGLLKKNFKKDTTAVVLMYRSLLQMLKIRDRGKTGNASKMITGFFGLGDNPYEEARKIYAKIRLAVAKDSSSIQLRLLSLGAAVESAEHLNELLGYASGDLRWLQARVGRLDSAETFFYGLSWAKYAYKYAIIKGPKTEAKKGFAWITFAEQFAMTDGYCDEAYLWWIKIDSLQTQ